MKALLNSGVVKHTKYGLTNRSGNEVGYHKTKNKVYIEDRYVDIADQKLKRTVVKKDC